MTYAIAKFEELESGILNIIRAADIYAVHVMAQIRGEKVDLDLVATLLNGNKITGFNLFGGTYSEDELELLEREKNFLGIAQQIVVATHTALEAYLILKFKEYYAHIASCVEERVVSNTIKRFSFRGTSDLKTNYKEILGIHLPSFEVDFHSSKGCSFQPLTSWDAIQLIYDARNDIVHKGRSVKYKATTLMDSWYPFEFVRNWVGLFDANFDRLIYEGGDSKLLKEYRERVANSGCAI